MADRDPAPHELRILLAVAEEGGFSAAADRLGLTQSAISHSVRGSERKLGAVLFTRGRTGAAPTAAGQRAVVHARRVLQLLEVMAAEVRGAQSGTVGGELRIAAFRSAAMHLLPEALRRLRERHPGLDARVRVVRELDAGTAGEVLAGRAEVGIATLGPDASFPAGLVGAVLLEEPYSFVHPVGHPAPRSLPLVDWEENCGSYTHAWWQAQEWIPRATVETEDDGAVLAMVAAGHGMAIMPALSLTGAPPTVEVVDLGPDRPHRRVGYVTTPALAGTAAVRALVRELRQART